MNTIVKEQFEQGAKEIVLELDDENSKFVLKVIIEKSNLNLNNGIDEAVYTLIWVNQNDVIIHKEIYFTLDKVLIQLENYIQKIENKLSVKNKENKAKENFEQVDWIVNPSSKDIKQSKKQVISNKKYHTLKNLQGEIVFVSDIELDEPVSIFIILNQYLKGWKIVKNIDLSNIKKGNKTVKIKGITFKNVSFENSDLSNVEFHNTHFDNVTFENSNLLNTKFNYTMIVNWYFYQTKIRNKNIFDNTILKDCNILN